MLPSVNCQHHDLILKDSKIDCIRKSRQYRPTRLSMNRLIEEGIVNDSADKCVEGLTELSPEPRTA